jgi:hypothetical protein
MGGRRVAGALILAGQFVALNGCGGVSTSLDTGLDGGFPDAPIVPVPPTYLVDESGDLGLLLAVRVAPLPADGVDLEELEVSAYDDTTATPAWVDHEPLPPSLRSVVGVGQLDPRGGIVELELRHAGGYLVRLDYDPRSEALVRRGDPELTPLFEELDFGAFRVRRQDILTRQDDERVLHDGAVEPFYYSPSSGVPMLGRWTIVSELRHGPGASLMLDALRYGPPDARVRNGVTEFFQRRVEGVRDVYLIEVATTAVVGLGERRLPEGVTPLYVGPRIERHQVVDRAGRVYFRSTAEVSDEPIRRAGIHANMDEVTLDWGEHEECLDTRIFAIGPAGHVLTRQRPDDRFPNADPDGVVCLFAPDGALVLALPAEPGRVWVGFSDPVQWFGP